MRRCLSSFKHRHIGIGNNERIEMLKKCNVNSMNKLINEINPKIINYNLPKLPILTEKESLNNLKNIINKNDNIISMIGMGYYNTNLPFPIKRHILENPNWYTAYTPYQPEISQGRLESQYNFQELIKDLTGLPISNASLLDEGSTSSEIMNMCYNYYKGKRDIFICSDKLHPQILDILKLKSDILDIKLIIMDLNNLDNVDINMEKVFGLMFQNPDTYGNINYFEKLNKYNILKICSTDLMSLIKLKPPNVDIIFGNSQRFGVPLWYGGPHPAFITVKKDLLRLLPGKLIGKTKDVLNNDVYRLSLQTREQHIRKDKATSNICTSQSLLTNVVSFYSIYHGKTGLINIAENINNNTKYLSSNIKRRHLKYNNFYDTIVINCSKSNNIYEDLEKNNIIVRNINDKEIGISIDETITKNDINKIIEIYNKYYSFVDDEYYDIDELNIDDEYLRGDNFLEDDIYNEYTSETELLRYIKNLEKKDYTLCDGMIPLGSCTMKLNSVSQLEPLSWDKITNYHPYLPLKYVKGYQELIEKTGNLLKEITGFNHVSFQSNSGAMGEYSGLLCIKKYHKENDLGERNICLIPESAHGTNFASASISNFKVKKFNDNLFENLNEFEKLLVNYKDNLGCLMITYPNTNGIFQDNIKEICDLIHKYGGLVYMDGANMNAQVGLTNPSVCGADVCHLNLHKTFCIPHGGGGPGMGPILCNDKLGKYLPTNNIQLNENNKSIGTITSSNWSSASLLTIPYMYISMMGNDLKEATEIALLNSNYLKESLKYYYTIVDINKNGRVGHEFIIDISDLKKYNITENDIAKRLMDYSFHPPTMSWPKTGVLMIEPTESESKGELDRFIKSMISIKKEIDYIIENDIDKDNNILKNSPHTFRMTENWNYNYSIKEAFYPIKNLYKRKYDIPIGRVNDLYGDKLLLQK